jgi:hypothetical protein
MPWHAYRGMTDEDIAAMFAYMRTLKPVRHHVDNTEAPTLEHDDCTRELLTWGKEVAHANARPPQES